MRTVTKTSSMAAGKWFGASALALVLAAQAGAAEDNPLGQQDAEQTQQTEPSEDLGVSRNDGPLRDKPAADNWGESRNEQEADMEYAGDDADQGMASDTTAQDVGDPTGQAHQDNAADAGPQAEAIAQQAFPNIALEDLQGRALTNLAGDEVGQIENVVVNAETGEAALLVSVGGILGVGAKEVLVDAEDVEVGQDQDDVVWQSSGNEEALKSQPQYRQQEFVSVR